MGVYPLNENDFLHYETDIRVVVFFLFLFFLLMFAFYLYIRFSERRPIMLLDSSEYEVGDEIGCGIYSKGWKEYRLLIKKLGDTDWIAYKLFRSGRKVPLRRGDLSKIVEYMNRNFEV